MSPAPSSRLRSNLLTSDLSMAASSLSTNQTSASGRMRSLGDKTRYGAPLSLETLGSSKYCEMKAFALMF
jgi:hypothetical protein